VPLNKRKLNEKQKESQKILKKLPLKKKKPQKKKIIFYQVNCTHFRQQ
jgi:hypothetical protein